MKKCTDFYDSSNLFSAIVGKNGIRDSEYKKIASLNKATKKSVLQSIKKGSLAWVKCTKELSPEEEIHHVAKKIPKHCTDLLVLGIGGSDLGAKALLQALPQQQSKKTFRIHFAGSSTNPDDIEDVFSKIPWKKTCINVISKSGGTLETMSVFLLARSYLIKAVGKKRFAKQVIATTDPEKGLLFELAEKERYHRLTVPVGVGGRFSALSSVGLFPAYLAGIDISQVLKGAERVFSDFCSTAPRDCQVTNFSALHYLLSKKGKTMHVLMPYSQRLKEFTRWYRQLFAESLGKRLDRNGKEVYAGLTPVGSIGPEDQHSQLQLYEEGPFDKVITFLQVLNFETNSSVPEFEDAVSELSRFSQLSFSDIVHAELHATRISLSKGKRPNDLLCISQLDEQNLGKLFAFFELSVAMLAEFLFVSAYDQPGVERSKKIAKDVLSI